MTQALINKNMVKKNKELKKTVKQGKKIYDKGNRKILKNYVGKVITVKDQKLLGRRCR